MTGTSATSGETNGSSNNNEVVKIVVPIVVCIALLICIGVAVIVIYHKKKSKGHLQLLQQGDDAEEGGTSQQPTYRSGSPWGLGSNGRVSPEPAGSSSVSSKSSSPVRPPHSPEPKEFLPPVDNNEVVPSVSTSSASSVLMKSPSRRPQLSPIHKDPPSSDGRRSASGNRVSPAPHGSDVSVTTHGSSVSLTSTSASKHSERPASTTSASRRPERPPHSPEPTEFLAPIVLPPVETDC